MPTGCVALLLTLGIGPVLGEAAGTDPMEFVAEPDLDELEAEADEGLPLVSSLAEVLAAAPAVEIPARPTLVRHRIRPRERLTHIAIRYGVRREDLLRWNPSLADDEEFPSGRRTLKVKARRLPPPRVKVRYVVQADEDWMDVAVKFHVPHRDLHAYNWNLRTLQPGQEITLWIDPGWPQTLHPGEGPPVPERFDVPMGALSVGRPNRGRLQDGVLLPLSDLYTRKEPTSGLWGSSHAILQIHRAFAIFRHDTGYEGEVVIGALSRRRGGRFSPHVSHQSGRDIDIRLPLWPGADPDGSPSIDEIDWYAAWGLVRAFIDTGEVDTIFLDVSRHRFLYEAARGMGETPESLEAVIKWPRWSGDSRPVVRHSKGHDTHIHVRIKCGPDEPRCRKR
ncbi:MAG: penicillin-insensitive murein endopeptidase [Myxococcales bacterium]|nr:penicillin-insensitive murein endopeptidase [Myxococcales bacterium]